VISRPVVAGLSICGLVLALGLVAAPQSSSPETAPPSSSRQATFTSNSELVLVPVQVMDHGGQPLRGLKKDDFFLESDAQPQQIAVFDEVRRSTQVMIPSHKPEPATPPTSFSNLPPDGIPRELIILAVDRLNTVGYLQKWIRDQLIAYLRAHPPQEPTALVMIAPDGLLEFHAPTWDGEALIQALQRMHVRGDMFSPTLTPDLRTSFLGRPGDYAMMMADLEQKQQAQLALSLGAIHGTLRSFEQIARAYSGVPGRKTVLWLTTGFPALNLEPNEPPRFQGPSHETPFTRFLFGEPRGPHLSPVTSLRHMGKELAPEFQQAFDALNRANVVLYPVDVAAFGEDRLWNVWSVPAASSIVTSPLLSSPLAGNPSQPGTPPLNPASPLVVNAPPFASWAATLAGGSSCTGVYPAAAAYFMGGACDSSLDRIGESVVARSTGGEPCDAGNHLEHCIEKAEAESNGYYLLGFYVPQQSRQAGWHELKVTVSGDHGPVRTRSGYYLDGQERVPGQLETHMIDDAIDAALEYTGILVNVEVEKWDEVHAMVPFRLSVAGDSIMTVPQEDKLSFDVVSVPISAHGLPIQGTGRITKIDIDHSGMQKALAHGWKLIDLANAPKTAIAVKVVVRDNVTGRIGSVVFPLAEHAAAANGPAPDSGAVLLLDNKATDGQALSK